MGYSEEDIRSNYNKHKEITLNFLSDIWQEEYEEHIKWDKKDFDILKNLTLLDKAIELVNKWEDE